METVKWILTIATAVFSVLTVIYIARGWRK